MQEYAVLPPLFDRWVSELLGGPIPAESQATCDDCAMAPPPGEALGPAYFRPDTKCCSFVPALPNFLVGGVLQDDDPALASGRASVLARISAGAGVEPAGLAVPPAARLLHHGAATHTFGRARVLRCPHFVEENATCGIWRYRERTCTTWYCKHDRGEVGLAFWDALRAYLRTAERAAARWCVAELADDERLIGRLLAEPSVPDIDAASLDGVPDPATAAERWGAWAGREAAFYRACWEKVAPLSAADVRALGGIDLGIATRVLRGAYRRLLDRQLPPMLTVRPLAGVELGPEWARVVTYRTFDPLEMPNELLRVLPRFDGRPTADVILDLEAEGLELDPELLVKLVDFGVLRG